MVTFWVKDVSLIPSLLAVKFEFVQNDGLIMRYAFNVIVMAEVQPSMSLAWIRTGLPIDCTNEYGKEIFSQYGTVPGICQSTGKGRSRLFSCFWRLVSKWRIMKDFSSSLPDCKTVGPQRRSNPRGWRTYGDAFFAGNMGLKRLNCIQELTMEIGNRYHFENSHLLQNLGHIVMLHGTADDFPSNILWKNLILERQGWILWENARLFKDGPHDPAVSAMLGDAAMLRSRKLQHFQWVLGSWGSKFVEGFREIGEG